MQGYKLIKTTNDYIEAIIFMKEDINNVVRSINKKYKDEDDLLFWGEYDEDYYDKEKCLKWRGNNVSIIIPFSNEDLDYYECYRKEE